ncbi:MAG: DMT family transporter, partial [Pseudomonadota bacterium]
MRASHWAVLLAAALMYGSAFSFTSVAVAQLPPLTVAAGRALTAALALAAILALAGGRLPAAAGDWRTLAVLGIVSGALPFIALAWGQVYVQSSIAGILFGITPIFTLFIAHFLTPDDRVTRRRFAGALAGFAGVALVVGPAALLGLGRDLTGQALILFAALCIGFGAVYARRHTRIAPLAMSTGSTICAAAVLLPLSLVIDGFSPLDAGPGAAAAVFGL